MNSTMIGIATFAFTFGAALFGLWLRAVLPRHHLEDASKDTIKVGIGLIATITALVLGLITASAKSSFDSVDGAVKETATRLLTLDRVLARYGPETREIRIALKQAVGERIEMIWPAESGRPARLDPTDTATDHHVEGLADAIRTLAPRDDLQRALQNRAVELAEGVLQSRWLVLAGTEASVPLPFLIVLLFWLAVTFTSYGMLAPRNRTVIAVLLVCALSIGCALFLVLEMDGPFDGLLRVSPDPLRYAHAHIGR